MPPRASCARAGLIRTGLIRTLGPSALLALALAILPASVLAQDEASLCLITAERVDPRGIGSGRIER